MYLNCVVKIRQNTEKYDKIRLLTVHLFLTHLAILTCMEREIVNLITKSIFAHFIILFASTVHCHHLFIRINDKESIER